MQFQVPQFLDVEDKVIGPLTIKQFLYLIGGCGLGYMGWRFIPYIGFFIGLSFFGLGVTLAFYKFNNKPFVFAVENGFNYLNSSRLYIWRRKNKEKMETQLDLTNFHPTQHTTGAFPLNGAGNKLSDLNWSMDLESKEVVEENLHSESAVI